MARVENDAQRARYRVLREKGLCTRGCGRKARPGRCYCLPCAMKESARARKPDPVLALVNRIEEACRTDDADQARRQVLEICREARA